MSVKMQEKKLRRLRQKRLDLLNRSFDEDSDLSGRVYIRVYIDNKCVENLDGWRNLSVYDNLFE